MPVDVVCDNQDCSNSVGDEAVEVIIGEPIIEGESSYYVDAMSSGVYCSMDCARKEVDE